MKFTIAAAVATFAAVVVAVAEPDSTVYSTHIVTITSCPPEVPVCPGRTQTSYVPVTTETPVPVVPTSYSNSTTPCPSSTTVPVEPTVVVPVCPGEEICHPPHTTGVVVPPANTTVPVVPTNPPVDIPESSAGKMGASLFAVAGAVAFAMLA